MHARTPAAHIRLRCDGEAEDDEAVWQGLRARAEQTLRAQQLAQVRRHSPPAENDWDALRALAERRHASEVKVAARAANAPPPLPRRQLPSVPALSFAVPIMALDEGEGDAWRLLDDDALRLLSRRRRALPVLLVASLVVGIFATALTRHLLALAEQQAHIEEVISDIRSASAQHPASATAELAPVRPQAEAPTSETVRAFQKLSVAPVPPGSAPATRASRQIARPSWGDAVRKPQPAPRILAETPAEPLRTSGHKGAAREIEPDLSDDPLRDL